MQGTKIWLLGGLTALVLSGCGLLPGTERTETEEVHVGDTVSTSWFDYTITSAQSADSYQDRTADEGCKLIVVELTIQNRFDEPVPMYDSDFQLYWGEYAQDQWALPLEPYCSEQLPQEYSLAVGETREGALVYQVPDSACDFTLAFLEVFDNGTVSTRMNGAAGFAGGPQLFGNTPRLLGRSMLPRPEPETPGHPGPVPPPGTG